MLRDESPVMEPNKLEKPRAATAHPSGDVLENYALGRLVEPELGHVETHLFVCHSCQDALIETDEYVSVMKSALAEPLPEAESWSTRWAAFAGRFTDSLRIPRTVPVYCAALATLSLMAVLSQGYVPGQAEGTAITLRSVRGGVEATRAQGPAAPHLRLRIESPYLSPDQALEARIVDAGGKQTWAGRPLFHHDTGYVMQVDSELGAGTYWVRLYDSQQRLLQEYGLQLR